MSAGDERGVVNGDGLDAAGLSSHSFDGTVRLDPMLRRIVFIAGVLLLAIAAAAHADPRRRHQINPIPFSHEPCSVLAEGPCTPSYCSVFNHGPCIPEIYYPYGENLQVTVQTVPAKDDEDKYKRPDHDLDTIGDLFAELRSCWSPPPTDVAHEGMQMSVRFSFKKSGEMIGPPRLTFATKGVPADTRDTYLKAINTSLDACIPLKFTNGLGGALAGRPIAIRYVDNRELNKPQDKP
jgi:hypothetical protein